MVAISTNFSTKLSGCKATKKNAVPEIYGIKIKKAIFFSHDTAARINVPSVTLVPSDTGKVVQAELLLAG